MTFDPVKRAWQASVEIAGAPPLEDVHKGTARFYRVIKWRNRVEYAGCLIAVVVFAKAVLTLPHIFQKIGAILVIAATFFAAWQLHRRASAVDPEAAGTMPILEFARRQLIRQRDAMRSIFWWYIAPFLPGIFLILFGGGLHPEFERQGPPVWVRWLALVGMASILVGIWWLNQFFADKLQRRIDAIEDLMDESR